MLTGMSASCALPGSQESNASEQERSASEPRPRAACAHGALERPFRALAPLRAPNCKHRARNFDTERL
jgi:hypothetical protein